MSLTSKAIVAFLLCSSSIAFSQSRYDYDAKLTFREVIDVDPSLTVYVKSDKLAVTYSPNGTSVGSPLGKATVYKVAAVLQTLEALRKSGGDSGRFRNYWSNVAEISAGSALVGAVFGGFGDLLFGTSGAGAVGGGVVCAAIGAGFGISTGRAEMKCFRSFNSALADTLNRKGQPVLTVTTSGQISNIVGRIETLLNRVPVQ